MANSTLGVDSDNILEAFHSFTLAQSVMLTVVYLIVPFELWGFCEYMRTPRRRDQIMIRMRWCLALNVLFLTILAVLCFYMSVTKDMTQSDCDTLARTVAYATLKKFSAPQLTPPHYSASYLLGVFFAYLFFVQKVKMVSRFTQDSVFKTILWTTEIVFAAGMLAFLGVSIGLMFGELTTEKRCVQIFPTWLIWMFTASNVVISGVLIYLFVWPLRSIANSTGISAVQSELKRIYWRNMAISSFAVLCTTLVVNANGVLSHFALEEEREDLRVIGLTINAWDAFVLAICCRLTTLCWLPKRIRNCRRKPEDDDFVASNHVVVS